MYWVTYRNQTLFKWTVHSWFSKKILVTHVAAILLNRKFKSLLEIIHNSLPITPLLQWQTHFEQRYHMQPQCYIVHCPFATEMVGQPEYNLSPISPLITNDCVLASRITSSSHRSSNISLHNHTLIIYHPQKTNKIAYTYERITRIVLA